MIQQIQTPPTESILAKVLRGGALLFSLQLVNRCLGFLRTIVLARLLSPDDFGLLGIAMLAISVVDNFSQTGFQTFLIQKKDVTRGHLDTSWTLSAARGVILFLILFFSAPLISRFFNSPDSALIIRVIAATTILSGFRNIGILFFQKELEFKKQFTYEFGTAFADLIVTITLAIILKNVWALVWGGLAANLFGLLLSYVVHPYRPRISLDKNKLQEIVGFGKWMTGSSILVFLVTQGDDLFVGKWLGAAALGLYQMAYYISNLPATQVTHMLTQVTFPAYAKLQDDIPKLRAAYLDVLQVTACISIPLAAGIFLLAPEFTRLFMGEKWMPMVPAMRVLVLAGLARSVAATTGPVFNAIGRPGIDTKWQLVRLILLVISIYPLAVHLGILGVSISVLLSISVSSLGFCATVISATGCRISALCKRVAIPLAYSCIMAALVLILQTALQPCGIPEFFFLVGIGILSYIFASFVLDRFLGYGMITLIKEKLASL
ncbi:MAG: lipopolysaccharide biosynthesis protein [Syntrophales bacterium]|nr:lipopolysaccharide biosynthesis protein [Syntrophales bacterium]